MRFETWVAAWKDHEEEQEARLFGDRGGQLGLGENLAGCGGVSNGLGSQPRESERRMWWQREAGGEVFEKDSFPRYISSSSQWMRGLALVRRTPWVVNFRERGRGKWRWHHQASHSGSQMVINLGQEAPRLPQVL